MKTKVRITRDSLDNIIETEAERHTPDFRPTAGINLLLKLMVVAFLIVGFALIAIAFIEPQAQTDTIDRDKFNPVITYVRAP